MIESQNFLGNLVEPVFRFQYGRALIKKMSWNIHIVIFEVTNPRIVLEYNFTEGNNMEQLGNNGILYFADAGYFKFSI